ncbi:MAG: T9SS type A sorting domain-containing protein [candidate division Zixibacteria bacterium]|nr:T9SS type A sorting domain-containing protein [candidate division Zixibacteria bacterium]
MVKRIIILSAMVLMMSASIATAQIATESAPFSSKFPVAASFDAVNMGTVDVAALLAEDEVEEAEGLPFRFGYPHDVNFGIKNAGTWEDIGKGYRVWRLRIECPGAYSINLLYDQYELEPGAELFIYNEDRSQIIGAFTSNNNKEHGLFSTSLVKGDVCIVEYCLPPGVGEGKLNINRIVHAYKSVLTGYGDSGSCNNNVHCSVGDPWANEIRAVAMIVTGGGTRWCTGSMVNNVRQDQTPYFLTANHCLGGETSWVFYFNYESPGCSNQDGPTNQTISGSTLLADYSTSDFGLLQLSSTPPTNYNIYYGGWSNVDTPSPSAVAIHHPSGDIKKISFEDDPITSTDYLETSGTTHWRVADWDDGTTEGGSSGSPLYDNNHRVIGQLHGGYAACSNNDADWYGKFSRSWTGGGSSTNRLRDWLDPDNTGATVLNGLDPNNMSGYGTIEGRVTDASNGQGIAATVRVTNRTPNIYGYCSSQGYYTMNVPADTLWQLEASFDLFYNPAYSSASVPEDGSVTRNFSLTPTERQIIFSDDFSSNQGWTGTGGSGEWTISSATGGSGSDSYGGPDPSTDHSPTSDNGVLGTDLTSGSGGDYNADLSSTYWVTSPVIDCSNLTGISFSYWRWLGVERDTYDEVYLQVYNGSSWITLFENDDVTIDESSWSQYTFDVSGYADNNSGFRIRYGIGPSDGSWQYCGWNIDDIEVSGNGQAPPEPDVTIDMVPDSYPVYTTQGGYFNFTGKLFNNTAQQQYTDVWIMLVLPNSNWFGPIRQWYNIPLAPNDSLVDSDARQHIPGYALIGDYEYWAFCGDYPSAKMDSATFDFLIFAGLGKGNGDWNVDGWIDGTVSLPQTTALNGNFPNPFNAVTTISYDLAKDTDVTLEVFNLLGQKVETLVSGYQQAGHRTATWDASKNSSGIYLFKLTTNGEQFVKRMTLLK